MIESAGDVALLSVWISLSCGSELQLSREQIDAKTGLKIHFPSTWTIDGTDPFTIVDFRPSKRPPQALVSVGGAQISIGAPRSEKLSPLRIGFASIDCRLYPAN